MTVDVKERVREALREILLPGIDKNLIDAGMLERIGVEDDHARVLLNFKPAYASKSQIKRWVSERVGRIEGISQVDVEFVSAAPQRPRAQQQTGRQGTVPHGRGERPRIELAGVKERVAIFSGKGGVGKSTVSLNVAVALARSGARVGLFDADVHGPNLHNLLGVRGQPMLSGGKIVPVEKHGLKMISIGLLVDAEEALIWRGPMITKAINELLEGTDWGELDVLVIDLPPGTGDAQLGLAQDLELTGSIAVTTPQEVSLADVRRGITTFRRLEVPLWGVVENMSYYACPHCGTESALFGRGGGRREAERQGVPLLGEIPLDPAIRVAEDHHEPVVIHAPKSPAAREFERIAEQVLQRARQDA